MGKRSGLLPKRRTSPRPRRSEPAASAFARKTAWATGCTIEDICRAERQFAWPAWAADNDASEAGGSEPQYWRGPLRQAEGHVPVRLHKIGGIFFFDIQPMRRHRPRMPFFGRRNNRGITQRLRTNRRAIGNRHQAQRPYTGQVFSRFKHFASRRRRLSALDRACSAEINSRRVTEEQTKHSLRHFFEEKAGDTAARPSEARRTRQIAPRNIPQRDTAGRVAFCPGGTTSGTGRTVILRNAPCVPNCFPGSAPNASPHE